MSRRRPLPALALLLALLAPPLQAQEPSLPDREHSQEGPSAVLNLETLRIQGTIYEPQVLFILERPSIQLLTVEEQRRHDFLKELQAPMLELLY